MAECVARRGLNVEIGRAIKGLRRELFGRRVPSGLVSPRYLLPTKDNRIRIHRKLWWEGRPDLSRFVWLFIELFQWLRWICFLGWRNLFRSIKLRGDQVALKTGVSKWGQFRALVRATIGCSVPPRDVYRYHLFNGSNSAWSYIFDQETAAFHRHKNGKFRFAAEARELLSDKLRQTEKFENEGIPVAPIFETLSESSSLEVSKFLADGERIFFKSRVGHAGIGAFAAWTDGGEVRGNSFYGAKLENAEDAENALADLIRRGDVVVQPALKNHPRFDAIYDGDDAITVRFITIRRDGSFECLCSTLEIPAGQAEHSGKPTYLILPIDSDNGKVVRRNGPLHTPDKFQEERILSFLNEDPLVPGWAEIEKHSVKAHKVVEDLWAVAWDWVVTPEGPFMLEGNSDWDVKTPQILHGGLLHDLDPATIKQSA